jgi:hypothetical protein
VLTLLAALLQDVAEAAAAEPDLTTTLVTAIAGSSPFAALAVYVITSQRADLKEERAARDQLMRDVIAALAESNRLHPEVIRAIEVSTVQAHALAGQRLNPEQLSELIRLVRESRAARERRLDDPT